MAIDSWFWTGKSQPCKQERSLLEVGLLMLVDRTRSAVLYICVFLSRGLGSPQRLWLHMVHGYIKMNWIFSETYIFEPKIQFPGLTKCWIPWTVQMYHLQGKSMHVGLCRCIYAYLVKPSATCCGKLLLKIGIGHIHIHRHRAAWQSDRCKGNVNLKLQLTPCL